MATVTKAQQGKVTTGSAVDGGTLRKTAQREYIAKLQEPLTKKDPNALPGVFVVPFFDEKGKNTGSVVRETVSPTMSMVMVMSVGAMEYVDESRMWRQDIRNTLIFAPTALLEEKYKAGNNIGGKIVTKYSFGSGNDRDIQYGIGTDIPTVNEDGEVIYRRQFWTPDLTKEDDAAPLIKNLEEIKQARAVATAANKGKLPTTGVRK